MANGVRSKRERDDPSPCCQHQKKAKFDTHSRPSKKKQVSTLLDIAAKCVAKLHPYQEIEERLGHVPGPVRNKIIYNSFPANETSIALYSSNKLHMTQAEAHKQPFHIGLKLYENEAVCDVIQIGFYLSGAVHEKVGICNRQKVHIHKCSMTFDRNCITSTQCTCKNKSLLWCPHIVAVAIHRIRNPDLISIKPPISDSVLELNSKQLQKLLLSLVTEKQNEILPIVQKLLDQVKKPDSEISMLPGIPDPTAGGCCGEERLWHMDETYIKKQVTDDLMEGSSGKNTISLLNKVREMLSVNDGNFVNLLTSITETILEISTSQPSVQPWSHVRKIYDELQALWMCIMASPLMESQLKTKLTTFLRELRLLPSYPRENGDDPASQYLLESVLDENCKEDLWKMGAEIDATNLANNLDKALVQAKVLLTSLKETKNTYNDLKMFNKPTEPIFVAYNIFISHGDEERALELALISLSQSYTIPHGEYAQSRLSHRYEQLLSQLESLNLSSAVMQGILLKYSKEYYNSLSSKVDEDINMDILPNHCFVRFLFQQLIGVNKSLACDLALYMLPLNLNKRAVHDGDEEDLESITYNNIFLHIKTHLEHQQSELAACLLRQCYTDLDYLKLTLTAILEEVYQPQQLLRLSKLCQTLATRNNSSSNANQDFQSAAFELGVRSIRLISDVLERKSCIRWLVSCAVDTGRAAVDFLIRNWNDLFSPKEISSDVAPMLTSQPVCFHLKMTSDYNKEELLSSVSNMVIEACIKEPVPCVLFALTLCEDNIENFELVCQIISDSSERFNAAQLFSVGRYLENKKHHSRAFKVGIRALKKLDIGTMDSQHPAVCDVFWICTLACTLGINEMTQLVPVIENCIHNPLILTDIAQRCSSSAYVPHGRAFSCYKEPLNRLVASAQKLFIQDVEVKLRNITRKNYGDFTDYLTKIQRAFLLAEDGPEQFQWLIDFIMTSQKGKKKLHQLISQAFLNERVSNTME